MSPQRLSRRAHIGLRHARAVKAKNPEYAAHSDPRDSVKEVSFLANLAPYSHPHQLSVPSYPRTRITLLNFSGSMWPSLVLSVATSVKDSHGKVPASGAPIAYSTREAPIVVTPQEMANMTGVSRQSISGECASG